MNDYFFITLYYYFIITLFHELDSCHAESVGGSICKPQTQPEISALLADAIQKHF